MNKEGKQERREAENDISQSFETRKRKKLHGNDRKLNLLLILSTTNLLLQNQNVYACVNK